MISKDSNKFWKFRIKKSLYFITKFLLYFEKKSKYLILVIYSVSKWERALLAFKSRFRFRNNSNLGDNLMCSSGSVKKKKPSFDISKKLKIIFFLPRGVVEWFKALVLKARFMFSYGNGFDI